MSEIGIEPRGSVRTTLRAIVWVGGSILVLGIIGCIAGFATIPSLGHAPENQWAEFGLSALVAGLFIPVGLVFVHLGISTLWVNSDGEWKTDSSGLGIRLTGSAAYLALAAGFGALGAWPLLLLTPDRGNSLGDTMVVLIVGLILAGIALAAIAGGMTLAGWIGILVGVIFGLGFASTALGVYANDTLWTWLGIAALVLGGSGFFFARAIGQRRAQP